MVPPASTAEETILLMKPRHHDLYQLSELLEAESQGRPVDRSAARHLALRLAERHPEIGKSMRLICDRIAPSGTGPS
jgi:hypothetical protein